MVKVKLITYTLNPLDIIFLAAKRCRLNASIDSLIKYCNRFTKEDKEKLVRKLIKWGHHSVLEHVVFTFAVDNISRVCSHQIVRHRLASYSQLGQRHKIFTCQYIMPESIKKVKDINPALFNRIQLFLVRATSLVDDLVELGVPIEDARFLYPQAISTSMIVTMNLRELRHFIKTRLTKEAQWEIRKVAEEMLEIVHIIEPVFVEDLVPLLEKVKENGKKKKRRQ